MGRLFVITLEGNNTYNCKVCDTHLALSEQILSKSFQCSNGIAYLFDKVVNITTGEKEDREMMTGVHTVVDIFCVACGAYLGWKYEAAYEKTQKYKEGKFILERFLLLGPGGTKYTPEVQVEESDDEPEDDEPEDDELDDA